MTEESIEQVRDRLRRQDEADEQRRKEKIQEAGAANAEARREREEVARAEELERRTFHENRQQAREREMKDSASRAYLQSGGRPEEFEEAWPGIRAEMLKSRTLAHAEEAHRLGAAHINEVF